MFPTVTQWAIELAVATDVTAVNAALTATAIGAIESDTAVVLPVDLHTQQHSLCMCSPHTDIPPPLLQQNCSLCCTLSPLCHCR